jgi:hypothetical protein
MTAIPMAENFDQSLTLELFDTPSTSQFPEALNKRWAVAAYVGHSSDAMPSECWVNPLGSSVGTTEGTYKNVKRT